MCADVVDEANERAQNFLDKALAKVPKPRPVAGVGVCLNPECGELIEDDRRWCCVACRNRWQEYQDARRRNA